MSEEQKSAQPTEPIGEEVSLPHAVEERPDYYGQLLRLKAEFENYRKRVDREKPEWVKLGRAEVAAKLRDIAFQAAREGDLETLACHRTQRLDIDARAHIYRSDGHRTRFGHAAMQ